MKHTARYTTSGTTPSKAVTGNPTSQHFFACSLYHTPPLIVDSLDDEMQIARPRIASPCNSPGYGKAPWRGGRMETTRVAWIPAFAAERPSVHPSH